MTLYTSLQIFKNTALDELIDNKQYVTYNVTNYDEIKISIVDYYPYFHRYDKIIEDSDLFLVDKEENYNPLSRYGLPEYFAYGKVMSEDKKIVQL